MFDYMTKNKALNMLKNLAVPIHAEPAFDLAIEALEEQKTGKWIVEHTGNGWNDWDNITCDQCGFSLIKVSELRDLHFCPHCGAKMEKKDD